MYEWFIALSPPIQALLAGCFTWAITAAGAALVFLTRRVNQLVMDALLGFSGGVMIAASYWSLLAPAIEISENRGDVAWFAATVGFLLGGLFLLLLDKLLPHLHPGLPIAEAEGPATTWQRSVLLVTAITMHNIPEGLAVGVAFGGVIAGEVSSSVMAAIALSIGIGLQNFPEGTAVAMPLRDAGMGRWKSFWYGQLSAVVEPIAAVIGAIGVGYSVTLLPYALSFAAGAMIFVVVEELIPESHRNNNADVATFALLCGFVVMMVLDVALG